MKKLFAAALLALGLSTMAQAETITLEESGCGVTRYCLSINNDANADIALYAGPTFANQALYLNGIMYTGPNVSPSVLYATDGTWVTLTTTFFTYRTCLSSGRGQHCSTHYILTEGSIVTQ